MVKGKGEKSSSSDSILPKTSQPAGRAIQVSLLFVLHPYSLLALHFGIRVVEAPGHEVPHGRRRRQRAKRRRQRAEMLLQT